MEAHNSNEKCRRDIIIFNILSSLPAKSLVRFKCVCKSVSSLIRSPPFVTAYSNYRYNKAKNLLFKSQNCDEDIDATHRGYFSSQIDQQGSPTPITCLSYIPSWYEKSDVQSINGLVCVSCNRYCFHYKVHALVYILNPSTRECNILHVSAYRESVQDTYHFGLCGLRNEYKVLQIFWNRNMKTGQLDVMLNIFTLGSNSWRQLKVDFGHDRTYSLEDCSSERSVCLQGAIHWVHKGANIVLVYDAGEEKFTAIPFSDEDYNNDAHQDNYEDNNVGASEYNDENYEDYDDSSKCYDGYDDSPSYHTAKKGIVDVGGYVGVFGKKNMEKKQLVLWILKDYHIHKWVKEAIHLRMQFTSEGYIAPYRGCFVDHLGTLGIGELAIAVQLNALSPSGYGHGEPQLHLYYLRNKPYVIHDFKGRKGKHILLREIRLVTSYDDNIVPRVAF